MFVNSMSDLFHEGLLFREIALVVGVIREAQRHTFQVLTKRGERMREFAIWWNMQTTDRLPDNLWLGVSVEDQATPVDLTNYLKHLDWVICGGESGPGARPMHPDWARDVRDQCVAAGVPFFFKQWGEYASVSEVAGSGRHHHFPDGATVRRVGKKEAGALLDGRGWKEFPR